MLGHGAGMGEAFFNLCGTESSSLTKPLGQKSPPSMPPSSYRVLVLLAFQYNIKAKLKQTILLYFELFFIPATNIVNFLFIATRKCPWLFWRRSSWTE